MSIKMNFTRSVSGGAHHSARDIALREAATSSASHNSNLTPHGRPRGLNKGFLNSGLVCRF
jgi:hypothetical protein